MGSGERGSCWITGYLSDNGVWGEHLSEVPAYHVSKLPVCLHLGSFMARAVGQVQTVPRHGRAGWAAGGLGTGGIEAGGVERLFHAALPAKLQGAGHLVSEWALPTSQEAMAIKEVG